MSLRSKLMTASSTLFSHPGILNSLMGSTLFVRERRREIHIKGRSKLTKDDT